MKNNTHNHKAHLVERILAVFVTFVTFMSLATPVARAWTLPSWLTTHSRLALANTLDDSEAGIPLFVIPSDVAPEVAPKESAQPAVQPKAMSAHIFNLSAYTSSVEECDSDPFTTADGSRTHDGIVATNILPFGTKLRIPALFGDKIFEVHDRMNARYNNKYNLDIWMEKKVDMRQFGRRNAMVEIVEMGDGKTQWGKKVAKTNK